jgi:hypothetical protein
MVSYEKYGDVGVFVEAIEHLQQENELLSEHCSKLEKPIIDNILNNK